MEAFRADMFANLFLMASLSFGSCYTYIDRFLYCFLEENSSSWMRRMKRVFVGVNVYIQFWEENESIQDHIKS